MLGTSRPAMIQGQRRLARSVEAVDQHPVTLVDDEVDVRQRGRRPRGSAAVLVPDAVQFEQCRPGVVALGRSSARGRERC